MFWGGQTFFITNCQVWWEVLIILFYLVGIGFLKIFRGANPNCFWNIIGLYSAHSHLNIYVSKFQTDLCTRLFHVIFSWRYMVLQVIARHSFISRFFLYHSVVMCFCRVLFAPRFQHGIFLKVNLFQLKFRRC